MKTEKNILVIFALFQIVLIGFGNSLPSALLTNTKNGKSTSTLASPTTSLTIAPTSATKPKKSPDEFEDTTTTSSTTTTTATPPPAIFTTESVENDGNSEKTADEEKDYMAVIIACSIGGFVLLIIILIVAILLIRRCLKRRRAAAVLPKPKTSDPTQIIDGTKTPTTDFKKTPPPSTNPWAPEHIPAETFEYKGPLILQTKPPTEIPMVHDLDNERPPSIHESHHFQFDDAQNVAYEIGSDVEIFMDGKKKMPKKARSSLPSPYGEPGGSTKHASGGGGGKKKKLSEKQKDKAIME